jgi:hypothetical protein
MVRRITIKHVSVARAQQGPLEGLRNKERGRLFKTRA